MNKLEQVKMFIQKQSDWCKRQDSILERMENKLFEMKELAEYACNNELESIEINTLNMKFYLLKQDVHSLEQQLQSDEQLGF